MIKEKANRRTAIMHDVMAGHVPSGRLPGLVTLVNRRDDLASVPGRYGWDGGYGTSWYADPKEGLIGILMTQRLWDSPSAPAVQRDFWTSAYQAIDD